MGLQWGIMKLTWKKNSRKEVFEAVNRDNTFKEKWHSSWKGMWVGEVDDVRAHT